MEVFWNLCDMAIKVNVSQDEMRFSGGNRKVSFTQLRHYKSSLSDTCLQQSSYVEVKPV